MSPKGPLYRHRTGILRRSLRYAPLTLTTLAALVPEELGAEVRIIDEAVEDFDEALGADLVGMTVITGNAPRAYELCGRLRERGVPVVLGGPHVTLMPEDAQPHADSVVVGYAEQTWPELLRDFVGGRLKPLYKQAADFKLAGRPFPRRELLDGRRYLTLDTFEATRGCIHDCDFCVVPTAWGRRPFLKPIEDVVDDIRARGAKKVIFLDLNLIADRDHATRLFEALIPLEIAWYGLTTTLLLLDKAPLGLAARSGCKGLLTGFESLSPESLRQTGKPFNSPQAYRELVDAFHAHGIALMGCFVFGTDSDTPDVFERTARFAVEAHIDLPRFAIVTPFPNTQLYKRLEAEGRILTKDWSLYDAQHVVFRPKRMSARELQEGHERVWRRVYSLPSIIRRLAGSRVQLPLLAALNLGYRFYARNLHRFYTCDAPVC